MFLKNFFSIKDTEQDYKKFLNGKTVALVGPASYLTKLDTGKYIDSFDIVVRINRGLELVKEYQDSIGTRTDIMYNCLIESPDNGGIINIDFLKHNKVKWIATIPSSDSNGVCKSNKLHKMVDKKTVKNIRSNFNFHIMNHIHYNKLNEQVESRANTGFAAIFDLLNCDISKLYITGFSFYLDDFMSGYKQGCERDEEEFAKQCFVSKRHKQKPQWEYLKQKENEDSRIEVDPILKKILNLDDLTREIKLI